MIGIVGVHVCLITALCCGQLLLLLPVEHKIQAKCRGPSDLLLKFNIIIFLDFLWFICWQKRTIWYFIIAWFEFFTDKRPLGDEVEETIDATVVQPEVPDDGPDGGVVYFSYVGYLGYAHI